ncbi:MAG: tetratricopeptide repeat protein [Pseudomonadota bacterium]
MRSWLTAAAVLLLTACAGNPTPSAPREPVANAAAVEIPDEVARDYNNAQTLLSVEDYAGAAQILSPLANRYPQFPAIATTLAISLRHTERVEESMAVLEATLAAHPEYAPALNEVGILYREAGRFEEAEAAYLKAVTVKPDYALAHFNFGILLDLYLARHEQAVEHYQRYQELVPDEDKQVGRWIADLNRRLQRNTRAAQVAQ